MHKLLSKVSAETLAFCAPGNDSRQNTKHFMRSFDNGSHETESTALQPPSVPSHPDATTHDASPNLDSRREDHITHKRFNFL